ncbi:hypothetical protein ACJMK2_041292 [Sinanodonta woodiana]|uniref:Uncharacterized protein n=1 Tax=Sinanodonta woodiana TaxID=1069815 RepID=A0ABD3W3P0_SINWO
MATAPRLMCGICRGPYKKPKILSCFHSFCEVCLESHILKAKPNPTFQCPMCRTAIDVPKGGACSLQNNFYIETTYVEQDVDKKETENVSKLCENCEDDERPEAAKYCEVCQLRICENCVCLHKKLKATQNHELVDLDSIDTHKRKELVCHEHDKEIANRYCFSCEDLICSSCKGHEWHTINDIDKAVEKKKEDVWRNLNESDAYFHDVEQRLKIIQDLETDIRESEAQAMADLGKRANEMKEEIDNEVKGLSVEIKHFCENELDKLNTVKTAIISAEKNKEITKNWISTADDKEILMTSDMMRRKILEINSSLPTIPTVSLVTFAENTEHIIDAKSVGLVKSKLKNFAKQGQIQMDCIQNIFVSSVRKIKFMVSYKDSQVLLAEEAVKETVHGLRLYSMNGSKRGKLMQEFVISGVDVDNDGNLFASVPAQNKVYKINRDRKTSVFCILDIPGSIAACPDGRVAVISGNLSKKLIVIHQNGAIFSVVQPSNGSFYLLQYIAVCKYTNILAAVDKGNNTIYLFNHKDQIVVQSQISGVSCIMSDNKGHFLIGQTNGVGMIDLQGNLVATLVCSQFSFQTTSLALDTLNQLWVGQNGQIFIFSYPDRCLT